jgi:hypothetical protein
MAAGDGPTDSPDRYRVGSFPKYSLPTYTRADRIVTRPAHYDALTGKPEITARV